MLGEIVAIFSAMGWAGDSVLVRLGTRKANVFAAMLVSFLVSTLCIWTYLFATTPLDFLRSPAVLYFVISGCIQPLLTRALFYKGITRIGVARAGPLRGSEPLFAAIIGVVFLHENPGLPVYLGTALIMGSLWLISGQQGGKEKCRPVDAALPISAALISAISQTLRKQGLKVLPDPFVATAVVTTVSLFLLITFTVATRQASLLRMERESCLLFTGAAFIATTAQVLNFVALGRGQISVIIPLLNTTPLFAVIFSGLLLRKFETVTRRIAAGAAVMVAGVVIITSR